MGVRSDIGVQNVHKILFWEDKGRSHKTSWSQNRGSFDAGTTVLVSGEFTRDYFGIFSHSKVFMAIYLYTYCIRLGKSQLVWKCLVRRSSKPILSMF